MEDLTPADVDRIVQAQIRVSGATGDALVASWRTFVFGIVERIALGPYRPAVVARIRDIVQLWSLVVPALTHPAEHRFDFPAGEVNRVRGLFQWLNTLAMDVLLSAPDLPPRTETEGEAYVEHLNEVALYVRSALGRLDALVREHGPNVSVYVTAREFGAVSDRCMTLVAIVLGPVHTASFKTQYDPCHRAWLEATRMLRVNPGAKPN